MRLSSLYECVISYLYGEGNATSTGHWSDQYW